MKSFFNPFPNAWYYPLASHQPLANPWLWSATYLSFAIESLRIFSDRFNDLNRWSVIWIYSFTFRTLAPSPFECLVSSLISISSIEDLNAYSPEALLFDLWYFLSFLAAWASFSKFSIIFAKFNIFYFRALIKRYSVVVDGELDSMEGSNTSMTDSSMLFRFLEVFDGFSYDDRRWDLESSVY